MKGKGKGKEVLQGGGVFQRVKGLWLFLQGGDGMGVGSGLVLGWNCGINWGLMFLIMGKCWKGGIIKCCFESGVCGENEGRRMVLFARVMRG